MPIDFATAWKLRQAGYDVPRAPVRRKSRVSPSTKRSIQANNAYHDSNTRAFNRCIDDLLKQGRASRYGS